MGKDLISSPYGRFFHLPRILSERGHSVRSMLLDYSRGREVDLVHEGIVWKSSPVTRYLQAVKEQLSNDPPDWVIGFSDTYFGILAARFGRRFGSKSCIDAYDNYESYLAWCKPLHWAWRKALAKADLVAGAGPALVAQMSGGRGEQDPGVVVPMAADPSLARRLDKEQSRQKLGLPSDTKLVGYCGSLHRSRGVDVLFSAMERVLKEDPSVRFVHSGRTWDNVPLPQTLTSLGYLPDENVPHMLNSMDTLVVVNRPSAFGHHSYPVKLYEAMACGVPVVATRTLATEWILEDFPERLVQPSDPDALASAIVGSLSSAPPKYPEYTGWESSCDAFERALMSISDETQPEPAGL